MLLSRQAISTEAGSEKRRVACHAVVLETFPPQLSQRHLALFPLGRRSCARQQMGAGKRTCHILTTCQTPSS
jgi:hypothetical protein